MRIFTEEERRELFPVTNNKIYFAHAGVNALPKPVADAICAATQVASCEQQEFGDVLKDIQKARGTAAEFIGSLKEEVALLGPTSLGLSLFANGISWREGDEVLCYHGDYPANVYPWMELRRRGVVVRYLQPQQPGEITCELVQAALTPRTRLVALASCHFFTGFRIDVESIGRMLHEREVLFSLDAIQTLGAFPLNVILGHVDFLSADAHKWMLGPLAIGIVYVRRERFEMLRPTLLGAWNVLSPNFQTQDEIKFLPTAQRYEPGVLNVAGIYGMVAALDMFEKIGMDRVAARLMELKALLVAHLDDLGFEIVGPRSGPHASGITTFWHPKVSASHLFAALTAGGVVASLRHDRTGGEYLRFSPHFYNTEEEIDEAVGILEKTLADAAASRPGGGT